MTRSYLQFIRKGRVVQLSDISPMRMLLDYLREEEGSRGTKEGCGEGDCGACTVVLGSLRGGRLRHQPFNACILLLGQIDGKQIITVEDLAEGGKLHPVQQALVDLHGSQCGFCTPGFVMSLFALYHSGARPDRGAVLDQIAGNLCRCTGYRPIVDAALAACSGKPQDAFVEGEGAMIRLLQDIDDDEDLFLGTPERFFAAPRSSEVPFELAAAHPDAVFLGGATDVGLWVTKQLRDLRRIIHLGRVRGLATIEETGDALIIGALASYEDAAPHLARIDPDVGELVRRIGAKQVRAAGTVGGNIANGSPIGDTPPVLIALGATVELRQGPELRTMPVENFFIAYGRQDRRPGELVWRIRVPKLKPGEAFRCYKISKRFDQDISAVLGAFKLSVEGGVVSEARIAYGGMAATPKRAPLAEAALAGVCLADAASWEPALAAISRDFRPIDDHRASAQYRLETARALLEKALMEIAGARATRVVGMRNELADAG